MTQDNDKTTQIKPKRAKRRRATKRELAKRDLRFIEKLAAGVTIEEIAASVIGEMGAGTQGGDSGRARHRSAA